MNHLNNTKQKLKLEGERKFAFLAAFVVLIGWGLDYLTNNSIIRVITIFIGMWIYVWALYNYPFHPFGLKSPRWQKLYRTSFVIATFLGSILTIVGLVGKYFFG